MSPLSLLLLHVNVATGGCTEMAFSAINSTGKKTHSLTYQIRKLFVVSAYLAPFTKCIMPCPLKSFLSITAMDAQRTAAVIQSSVCRQYYNDRCMRDRDDFERLCNGGLATASVSLAVVIITVFTALLL